MSETAEQLRVTEAAVEAVLAAHPDKVAACQAGEGAAIGFLLGQVMKMTGGMANAVTVNVLLRHHLYFDQS